MSEKSPLHIHGISSLPDDMFTETRGSNYGLDTFPELNPGVGSLEGVLNPNLTKAPALPRASTHLSDMELSCTGAVDEEDKMNLSSLMGESLANLDWLDPTQMQDPARLPHSSVGSMIPELVEAWSVLDRNHGLKHVVRDPGEIRYRESLENDELRKKASAQQMTKVVQHAMRRSAAKHDIKTVAREAMESMGEEMGRIAPILRMVEAEHGLVGNVYLRMAAYPGWGQGRCRPLIKKGHGKMARYLLVDEETLKQASWIHQGRCTYSGKIAVTEIPWEDAWNYYAPRFERRVAEALPSFSGSLRDRLRQAFLYVPPAQDPRTQFPTHDELKLAEARGHFKIEAGRKVYNPQQKRVASLVPKIASAIQRGVRGHDLRRLIQATFLPKDMRASIKMLTPLLTRTSALDPVHETHEYQGAIFTPHSASPDLVGPESHGRIAQARRAALRWVRQTMSEGFAGKDLDDLIQNRFTARVIQASQEEIRRERSLHEGGAGFMYVNASAYATPTGIRGCEKGALKHRTNQIPTVAAMPRCATCVQSRTLEDGSRRCSVYNKALLEDTTGPEMHRVRQVNIQAAQMRDDEQTAAMFSNPSNAFDPGEFDLRSPSMEFEVDFAEDQKMSRILFSSNYELPLEG